MKFVTTKQRIEAAKEAKVAEVAKLGLAAPTIPPLFQPIPKMEHVIPIRRGSLFTIYCHILGGFHSNVGANDRSPSNIAKVSLKAAKDSMAQWEAR